MGEEVNFYVRSVSYPRNQGVAGSTPVLGSNKDFSLLVKIYIK